ncbi:MAG: hypothetical protein ACYC2G_14255 [Gemmatimonadaceae bacterium]
MTLLAGIALLGGCGSEPTITEASAEAGASAALQGRAAAAPAAAARQAFGPAVAKVLATLRRVTATFHRFDAAVAAGWSAQITGCMDDPAAGGMGFHYGNVALIDGTVRVDEPELLLYERERNGRLRLLAVEYIIPYTELSRESEPPVLFGREFTRNDTFQLWGLHAWVWRENPSGMFASWNPRVGCENAEVSAMSHH